MDIKAHLDKENLHHAYLIEGAREEILPEIFKFVQSLGVETSNNSDFLNIATDSLKIEDARNIKSFSVEKANSFNKKIFIISANNFLLEAQNSLLKMFEEPIENTHFFLVVPDANILLETLVSRFYLISHRSDLWGKNNNDKDAEKFIAMSLKDRLDLIKELLVEPEDEDEEGNEIVVLDSARSNALKFLNALETVLHTKMSKAAFDIKCLEHLFKVREFLRMPGSSTKMLMESVALIVPN